MNGVRGILLDIDGTLVRSNDEHAKAWVRAMALHGVAVSFDRVRPLIGMGGDKLLPRVSGIDPESVKGLRIAHERTKLFLNDYAPFLKPTLGANELLVELKRRQLRLAIATSAKDDELSSLLKVCGADQVIDAKATSDDADESKPDPDIVEAALKEIELSATETLFIGDTPYDVEAGRAAGVGVIALRCGGWGDSQLKGAVAIFDDPADLLANLDQSPICK
jgi:HAD superfamily hydrolase (TIGR01549 family)